MGRPVKSDAAREAGGNHEMRDQEVLRANRELAAYFKGRRTEREARAALKIIKRFIRDREHADPGTLRPLPGAKSAPPARHARTAKADALRRKASRKVPRKARDKPMPSRDDQVLTPPSIEPVRADESS